MTRRFHLSALIVFAFLASQTAQECADLFLQGLLEPRDLAVEGQSKNEPALQAGASLQEAIEHHNVTEPEVNRALERHEPAVIEQAIDENPNVVRLRFLRVALAIAEDDQVQGNLHLGRAVSTGAAVSNRKRDDPGLQADMRTVLADALLQTMDTYTPSSAQWQRLQKAYCGNLSSLLARPLAVDPFTLATLPNVGCQP